LKDKSPRISVIIPCFNDEKFIEQAVNSAIVKTGEFLEVIVVDDGSDQKTKDVLKKLRPKITKLITQENKGVSQARNIGIANATHNTIVVLDSDDYFEEDFYRRGFDVLKNMPEAKLITCYSRRFDHNGTIDVIKLKDATLKEFLKFNAAMGSVMFRRSDWRECGGYDEHMLKGFEDWEFYIRLLSKGGKSYVIPETLFNYRIREHSKTTSANKIKPELLKYIYNKNKSICLDNFEDILLHYIKRIERVEDSEKKLKRKLEYRLGKLILSPFRIFKKKGR